MSKYGISGWSMRVCWAREGGEYILNTTWLWIVENGLRDVFFVINEFVKIMISYC